MAEPCSGGCRHLRRRIAKQDFQKWRAAVEEDAKEAAAAAAFDPEAQPAENGHVSLPDTYLGLMATAFLPATMTTPLESLVLSSSRNLTSRKGHTCQELKGRRLLHRWAVRSYEQTACQRRRNSSSITRP